MFPYNEHESIQLGENTSFTYISVLTLCYQSYTYFLSVSIVYGGFVFFFTMPPYKSAHFNIIFLISHIRGLSQKVADFCYKTRLCIRNSIQFVWYLLYTVHHINILHKFVWSHSLDTCTQL